MNSNKVGQVGNNSNNVENINTLNNNKSKLKTDSDKENAIVSVANVITKKSSASASPQLQINFEESLIIKQGITNNNVKIVSQNVNKPISVFDKIAPAFRNDPISVYLAVLQTLFDRIPIKKSKMLSKGNKTEIDNAKKLLNDVKNNTKLREEFNEEIKNDLDIFEKQAGKDNIIQFFSCFKNVGNGSLDKFFELLLPLLPLSEINLGAGIEKPVKFKLIELIGSTKVKAVLMLSKPFIKEHLKSDDLIKPEIKKFVLDNFDTLYSIVEYAITTILEKPEIKKQLEMAVKRYYERDLIKMQKELDEKRKELKSKYKIETQNATVSKYKEKISKVEENININPNSAKLNELISTKMKYIKKLEDYDTKYLKLNKEIAPIKKNIKDKETEILKSFIIETGKNLIPGRKNAIAACLKTFVERAQSNK